MRYSTNLNIAIKATEKVSSILIRDFFELQNLQPSPVSANKFAESSYRKVKKLILEDLTSIRPDFDVIFSGEEKTLSTEYGYYVIAVDGLTNLSRAIPNFTIAIALLHKDQLGNINSIGAVVNNVLNKEIYYCEKGFGAFMNSRKIRCSTRKIDQNPIALCDKYFDQLSKYSVRNLGSNTLSLSMISAGRADLCVITKKEHLPFLLLAKEAGCVILEPSSMPNTIVVKNQSLPNLS